MKAKYYNTIKKATTLIKAAILAGLLVTSAGINVSAQSVPGCPATVALTPVSTSCGVNSVDILPNINAYITNVLHLNPSLLTITVYTSGDLTHPLATTVLTESGTYIIKVTAPITGCVAALSIDVVVKKNPTAGESHTAITCFGGSSTVTVTASGGTSPYTGTGAFQQTVADGNKTYTVSDTYGCQGTVTVNTLSQPTAIVATFAPANDNDSVCVGFNRRMFVNASGGTPGYTYSFNGGSSYQVDSNLIKGVGTYSAKVKDANGCVVSTNSVTIKQPASKLTFTTSRTYVGCNNVNLSIIATGSYGNYTYSLNNGPYQASNIFTNVGIGSDSIFIKDARNCPAKGKVTIAKSDLAGSIAPSGNIDSVQCVGYSRTVIATGNNGTGPYTYSINGGSYQSSNLFLVQAGTSTATVKDATGCIVSTNSITIREPASKLNLAVGTQMTSCNISTVTLTATNGWGNYTYRLNNSGYQAGNSFTGLGTGHDSAFVKDNAGCVAKIKFTIAPSALAADLQSAGGIDSVQCYGFTRTIVGIPTNGIAPYTYSFDGTPYQSSNTLGVTGGTHNLSIKDAVGCIAASPNSVTIKGPASALFVVAQHQKVSCNNNKITVVASGGYGNYMYSIDSINFVANNIFTGLPAGTYNVYAMDNGGCVRGRTVIFDPPASPCFGAGTQSAPSATSSDELSAGKSTTGFDLRLKAYPNPSHGDFNLTVEGKTTNPIVEVRVFDMHGNIVYQTRGASTRSFVFGSKFSSGTYTVQVIDGRNVQTTKLIKAN